MIHKSAGGRYPTLNNMELLGKKAKDKISGFTGVATSMHIYLTGCTQFGIQAECKDNSLPDIKFFDEGRLEFESETVFKPESVKGKENGCDNRERP